jgi:hypothetical protein
MSKYEKLWDFIATQAELPTELSFTKIKSIVGFDIDHSFLNYKKELIPYGYEVEKISLKNKTVHFRKINS